MENKFDIIIIGSGLGGLICGAILSMEGKKVCILEQGKVFGGSLQSFYRKGIPIDTGIHYIGSMREGQIMNQYFKYLKLDNIPGCFLDDDFDNIILKDNDLYPYLGGYNNFYSQLASLFPDRKSVV